MTDTEKPATTPLPGEVWMDAEGTLMTRAEEGDKWWVFGVPYPIPNDRPAIIHPLTRMFDQHGKHVGGDLTYPGAFYFNSGGEVAL